MPDRSNDNPVQLRRNIARTSATNETLEPENTDELQIAERRHRFKQISVFVLLSLGILALGLLGAIYRRHRERPTDGSTEQQSPIHVTVNEVLLNLFVPFSSNKLEVGHVYFQVNDNATVTGTAVNQSTLPVVLATSIAHGTVFISDANQPILAIGVSAYTKRYDDVGLEKDQFFYRQVTSEKHLAYLACLINERQIRKAFSFTWINATFGQGNTAGDFQCVVVFVDESTTYLIRTYDSNIVDLNSGQFSIYDYIHSKLYDVELKAADVRNKRIVNKISDKPRSKTFPRIKENKSCHL